MERQLIEMPSLEVLSWFISGPHGGKDGKGVAVRFNLETHQLEPDQSFSERVDAWRNRGETEDPFTIKEMPDLPTLNAYLQGGVSFDLVNGVFENKRIVI